MQFTLLLEHKARKTSVLIKTIQITAFLALNPSHLLLIWGKGPMGPRALSRHYAPISRMNP